MSPLAVPNRLAFDLVGRRRLYRAGYILLCGALIALLGGQGGLAAGLVAALSGLAMVAMAGCFVLARRTLACALADVASQIEAAALTQQGPALALIGWAPHDRLARAMADWTQGVRAAHDACAREVTYYRMLAAEAPGLELFFDDSSGLRWMNRGAQNFAGQYPEGVSSLNALIDLWIYPKDRPLVREYAAKVLHAQPCEPLEARLIHRDGSLTWYLCRLSFSREVPGMRFSAQNMQRRKDAELKLLETVAALQRTQALKEHYLNRSNDEKMRLTALLDMVAFGIVFVDRDRRVTYINKAALQMWHLDGRERVSGVRDVALLELTAGVRVDDAAYRAHFLELAGGDLRSGPCDIHCRDGRVIREQSCAVPAAEGGASIGRVWIFDDVTESLQLQQRLAAMAECDPLTGLLNRRRFNEELNRLLVDTSRRSAKLALVMIDVRGFRDVCDRFGHQAGDEVLVGLADALAELIRRNEFFFRLEGDEFAILVPYTQRESVQTLAQRLSEKAEARAFTFADQAITLGLNLGLALAPEHGSDAESLLFSADRALSEAKHSGRAGWQIASTHTWNPVATANAALLPGLNLE